jgi:hypothetical protein
MVEIMLKYSPKEIGHGLNLRLLQERDVDEIVRLHNFVVGGLAIPGLYRASDRGHFARHIADDGYTLGVFTNEEELVAFAIIRFPKSAADNLGKDLGIPQAQLPGVAHLEECAVHPLFRGCRLQRRLITERVAIGKEFGMERIAVTIAPRNIPSLKSSLNSGLTVDAMARKYGGLQRLILSKSLYDDHIVHEVETSTAAVSLSNLETLSEMLKAGFRGHGLRIAAGSAEPSLLMSKYRRSYPRVSSGRS